VSKDGEVGGRREKLKSGKGEVGKGTKELVREDGKVGKSKSKRWGVDE
jgi:hypothetical protein